MTEISLTRLLEKINPFLKKGDFESAAFLADHYGYKKLAESYLSKHETIQVEEREIRYAGPNAKDNLIKGQIEKDYSKGECPFQREFNFTVKDLNLYTD